MARVNVYLPDDLARRARAARLNISGLTQRALRGALDAGETDRWLDSLERQPRVDVSHDRVLEAVDDARRELGARAAH